MMMFGHRQDLVFTGCSWMEGDLLTTVMHLNMILAIADPYLRTRVGPGYRITIAFPRYIRITCHLSEFFIHIRIWQSSSGRLEMEFFAFPPVIDTFMCCAVHTLVGNLPDPLLQVPIEVNQGAGLLALQSAQEVPAHILDAGFNLAFRLSAIRPAQSGAKTPVPGEIQKHRMPDNLATFVGSQPNCFHPIIKNLGGGAEILYDRMKTVWLR